MKSLRLLAAAAALLGFSTIADAGALPSFTPYASISTGRSVAQSFNGAEPYMLGAAFGVKPNISIFGLGLRDELAYDHFSTSTSRTDLGELSAHALSNKLYLEKDFGSFHPYVGAGLGWVSLTGSAVQSHNNGLGVIAAAGLMYDLTPTVQIGAGYEYWTSPNARLTTGTWQNNVLKGVLRVNF